MAIKHTPGPWHWDGNTLEPVDKAPDTSHVWSILQRDGGYGFLGSKPADTCAELAADYALIAAAPMLLASLKCMVKTLRDMNLPDQMQRPSEEQIESDLASAELILELATTVQAAQ